MLAGAAVSYAPNAIRVAAAADLRYAMEDLARAFHAQHPDIVIEPTYGSSGMFYAQLVNQAPFDIFLSADLQYPRKLTEQKLTLPESDFTYGSGRIVLWTGKSSGVDIARLGMDALLQPAVHHIAIANPAHAPYGRAAEAALRSRGLYDKVKDKLVMGENISQTFQMTQSGAAEVGIVALSLAIAPGAAEDGHYWEIPRDAYPRIEQGGAILKWTKFPEEAKAFRAFLLSTEGRAILKRYGFSVD